MRCPYCKNADSRVLDSREVEDGQVIRRRRSCSECSRRFTTVEEATLAVIKRSGVTEPFLRGKVVAGVRRACQGRPVDEDALAKLAQDVEDVVRASGVAEIPSDEVGLAILGPLRELDEVAFLRFASVYQSFDSVTDFEAAIADLRNHQSSRTTQPSPGVSATPSATSATDAKHDPPTSDTSGSGQAGSHSSAPAADAVPATV